jgi:hypothetical protein
METPITRAPSSDDLFSQAARQDGDPNTITKKEFAAAILANGPNSNRSLNDEYVRNGAGLSPQQYTDRVFDGKRPDYSDGSDTNQDGALTQGEFDTRSPR